MAKQINLREASRINWYHTAENPDTEYPGDNNITLGCLMRIADATEKMASNYTHMENDLKWYKEKYDEKNREIKRLERVIAGLRGHLTRAKGKVK